SGGAVFALPGGLSAGFHKDRPGPQGTLHESFHPLPVIPTVDRQLPAVSGEAGDVGVCSSPQALGHSRKGAIPAGGSGGEDDSGLSGFGQGLSRGGVGSIARRREVRARDTQESGRPTSGDAVGGGLNGL